MNVVEKVKKDLRKHQDIKKAHFSQRFFKTGKGQYAEDDIFLGISVPNSRLIAKKYQTLSLSEIEQLLISPIHEERLVALLILVFQFQKADESRKKELFDFYLSHTKYINNWDLVDLSADKIVGAYLLHRNRKILYKFARSNMLWEKRIAMIATYCFIKNKEYKDTFQIAEILFLDKHDLIHKAVGWMLREVGKRVSHERLIAFLNKYHLQMPRTALRYAVEHFTNEEKKIYFKQVGS